MGTEKIQNYECDKFHVVNNDKNMGESTLWISKELNYPLKVYVENPRDKATIIYSNIVEKKLEDHLFVLPSDYSKLEM
jgi:outer membrane lipoprotein-sorting protein